MECEQRRHRHPDQHLKHKRDWKDFAILYRGHTTSRGLLELKAATSSDPLSPVPAATSFFRPPGGQGSDGLLPLLVNPDRMTMPAARDQRPPRRENRPCNAGEARVPTATTRQISLTKLQVEWVSLNHSGASLLRSACQRFLSHWLDGVRQQCTQGDPIEAVNGAMVTTWNEKLATAELFSDDIGAKRMGNVLVVCRALKKYHRARRDRQDRHRGTPSQIGYCGNNASNDTKEEEGNRERVQLMDPLGMPSKGPGEYPHVFIIRHWKEEILPAPLQHRGR